MQVGPYAEAAVSTLACSRFDMTLRHRV